MALQIGDYIHYSYDNYKRYGISRNGFDNNAAGKTFHDAAVAQLKEIKSFTSQLQEIENLKQMEDDLTKVLFPKNRDANDNNNAVFQAYLEEALKIIDEFNAEDAMSFFINEKGEWDFNSKISLDDSNALKGYKGVKKISGKGQQDQFAIRNKEQAYIQRFTIDRLSKESNKILDELRKMGGENPLSKLNKLFNQIESLSNQLSDIITRLDNEKVKRLYLKDNKNINKDIEIIGKISYLIKKFNMPTNGFIGKVGEQVTLLGLLQLYGCASDGLKDIFQSTVGRGDRVEETRIGNIMGLGVNVKVTNWALEDLNTNAKGQAMKSWELQENNGATYFVNSSKGTIDLEVQLPPENQFNVDALRASVKTYSGFEHGISLISDTNLLSIIMLANVNFINHYLNLIYTVGENKPNVSHDLALGNNIIQKLIFIRGLSGQRNSLTNMSTEKLANCFIINDYKSQKVHVLSIKQLINAYLNGAELIVRTKMEPNLDAAVGSIDGTKFWVRGKNETNHPVFNQNSANTRIIHEIMNLNNIKIKMSIDGLGGVFDNS